MVDTIHSQLAQLLQSRAPRDELEDEEALALARKQLGSHSNTYGVWVHYPWRNTWVHLLAPDDFHELRTSRNDHKITRPEQAKLRTLKIGVAGLSVGSSSALTLAQEGIGGELRLADFDRVELSNLNRVRATVLDLGLEKTVVTSRAIAELDPFLRVTIERGGINEDNLGHFLDGLDLLVEECDDLAMKIRLREAARARGIPVIMETSDRGMLDIERFDLEPDRPLLHGLIGDLSSESLRGLTTYEKVPTVLQIIGAKTLSERMGASMVDIDTTLTTWPQLASAVALGGALNAEAARRIALGSHTRSGRFYADFEDVFARDGRVDVPPGYPTIHHPLAPTVAPLTPRLAPEISDAEVEELVAFACLAPSGGNVQPWQFMWDGQCLRVGVHPERGRNLLDYRRLASHLAVGAALEYLQVAADAAGWRLDEQLAEDPAEGVSVVFHPHEASADSLARRTRFATRATDRRKVPSTTISPEARAELAEAAGPSVDLVWCEALSEAAEVLAEGDRFRFFHSTLHAEMFDELRWSDEELARRRDGLDLAALHMNPTEIAGLRLLGRRDIIEAMKNLDVGQGLGKGTRDAVAASAAVLLVRSQGGHERDYLEGGRATARLWAEASSHGLGMHPMTALPYMLARLRGGGEGFGPEERVHLERLRASYEALFGGGHDLMLFRVFRAEGAPEVRSPRLALDSVFHRRSSAA